MFSGAHYATLRKNSLWIEESLCKAPNGTTLQLHSSCQIVYDLRVSREQAFCLCATTPVMGVRPGVRPRGSIGHSEWNMGLSKAVILAVAI